MTQIITDIDRAVSEIVSGNVIGIPTETVYGLAANALDSNAVLKIFETKQRPRFNPLIVHVSDVNEFEKYGTMIPVEVYNLAELYSPGPITFIVKKRAVIPDIVTAGNDSVALRVPSHPIFRKLIIKANVPVAAPSANASGKISPTSAKDVVSELDGRIDYVLDGGKCDIGIESTVLDFTGDGVRILRHGFVTKEEIENVIGKLAQVKSNKIISPGMTSSHYAPSTPLYSMTDENQLKEFTDKKIGILDFSVYESLKEIALNLYFDLRKLDGMNFDFIVYKKITGTGLAVAINDRLERASSGVLKQGNIKANT